jgi:hypothetical protein
MFDLIQRDLKKMKNSTDFLEMKWDWRTVEDAYKTLAYIHTFERESDDSRIGEYLESLKKENKKSKILEKFQVSQNFPNS